MRKRTRIKQMAEINVVPYIDVMLVLLVIFMVTTPLLSQGVKVDLPQAQAAPLTSDAPEPLIVSVDARGDYYLNVATNPNQPLSHLELATLVNQQLHHQLQQGSPQQQRQVLVKGDKNVDYGKVVQAMVILKNAGAASVGLMTQFDESNERDTKALPKQK